MRSRSTPPRPTRRRSRVAPVAPRSPTRWAWPCSGQPKTRGGRSWLSRRRRLKRRSMTSRSSMASFRCEASRGPAFRSKTLPTVRWDLPPVTSPFTEPARRPSGRARGFAAHLVEVEIDDVTGETRPVRYVAVQDVGFAINPAEVEAQIHGGVAQGLGWALYEGMVYDRDGQLLTATLMDYALPRAEMVPP